MGKLYCIITALLMALGNAALAAPGSYEWWLDNDYAGKAEGELPDGGMSFDVDASAMLPGMHYFNCRLYSAQDGWGSVFRKVVFTTGAQADASAYEYWFDNDYAGKTERELSDGSAAFEIDTSPLLPGTHYFNCRLYSAQDGWGSVFRKMVLTTGTLTEATSYEYWIDDNYGSAVRGDISDGANSYIVDLEGVSKGLHRFNYRICTGTGEWGSVYSKYFYYSTSTAPFSNFEYWLDDDYAGRKTGRTNSNPVVFDVDLAGFDKSGEAHYFNLRVRDDDGEWSSFYRKLIIFYKDASKIPLTGYRHTLNGKSLGYVRLENGIAGSHTFTVDIPDELTASVSDRKLRFDGDVVSVEGSDSVRYTLQIESELGWAPPAEWRFEMSHDFSTTAAPVSINTSHTFDNPAPGEFVAVKFASAGKPLYFRTDNGICLDIYKDGSKLREISSAELTGMAMAELEEGEYFGIFHDPDNDSPGRFTFHLMDTANSVPTPIIKFADGTVTISCPRQDAEIYYTLDESMPTAAAGTKYEEPFRLDHNAVVKAIATVPGSDIKDSSVAELVVDSYKVDNPVIEFVNLAIVITQSKLQGVRTYYTLDGAEPTQESELYSAPFTVSGNVKVRARSFKDGYNPSDIADYSYSHSVHVAQPPVITADGMTVTLTAKTPGSRLFYSIDDPSEDSMTEYSAPFTLEKTSTVYAQARKEGMYDSEVVSIKVTDTNPDLTLRHVMPKTGSELTEITKVTGIWGANTQISDLFAEAEPLQVTLINSKGEIVREQTISDIGYDVMEGSFRSEFICEPPVYEPGEYIVMFKGISEEGRDELLTFAEERVDYSIIQVVLEKPSADFDNGTVTMSHPGDDVEIRYTLDGSTPDSSSDIYAGPIAIERNCTVKAIATNQHPNYLDSEVTEIQIRSFKVDKPRFVSDGSQITIVMSELQGVKTYYTLDGTDPDETDMLYESPLSLTEDALIKARSFKDGYNPSDIAEFNFVFGSLVTSAPVISEKEGAVTINSATEGASVFYSIDDDDTENMSLYTGPFKVDRNVTVYAQARKEGMYDSEVVSLAIDSFVCGEVTFSYDGRYLAMTPAEEGTTLHYDILGENPASGALYESPVDVMGRRTVRVDASKDGYHPGYSEFVVTYYGDETHAEFTNEGEFESCFGWASEDVISGIEEFAVNGTMKDPDILWFDKMTSLRHLDLSNTWMSSVPDNSFRDSQLVSVKFPLVSKVGDNVFAGSDKLCAIFWEGISDTAGKIVENVSNPNLLFYGYLPDNEEKARNMIVNGISAELTLTDGYPFYCPESFTADKATYTRNFSKQTSLNGECSGWETMALPFDVAGVYSPDGRRAYSFARLEKLEETGAEVDNALRYWLYSPAASGWQRALEIESYAPYLIAMPNNPDYIDDFIVTGDITFVAENVEIQATPSEEEMRAPYKSTTMTPDFTGHSAGDGLYAVNDEAVDGYLPGSVFSLGLRDVRPFECYLASSTAAALHMPIFDISEVEQIREQMGVRIWSENRNVYIFSGISRRIRIYDTVGQLVRVVEAAAGETSVAEDFNPGIYIVDNQKIVVK